MVGKRRGRFALKGERELIALAARGATASEIALRFKTNLKTIEQKARALGISIKKRSIKIGQKAEKMERGRHWTPAEDAILRRGALAGRTAGAIAEQLGRTRSAVRTRAYSLRIILGRPPLTTGEMAHCHRVLAAREGYFGEGPVKQRSAIPKPQRLPYGPDRRNPG
jgi:DNA-binding CsgD family transcriptional regulator